MKKRVLYIALGVSIVLIVVAILFATSGIQLSPREKATYEPKIAQKDKLFKSEQTIKSDTEDLIKDELVAEGCNNENTQCELQEISGYVANVCNWLYLVGCKNYCADNYGPAWQLNPFYNGCVNRCRAQVLDTCTQILEVLP